MVAKTCFLFLNDDRVDVKSTHEAFNRRIAELSYNYAQLKRIPSQCGVPPLRVALILHESGPSAMFADGPNGMNEMVPPHISQVGPSLGISIETLQALADGANLDKVRAFHRYVDCTNPNALYACFAQVARQMRELEC